MYQIPPRPQEPLSGPPGGGGGGGGHHHYRPQDHADGEADAEGDREYAVGQ